MKISPEIFMNTIQQFIKILQQKKGIEKLGVKKFIKKIEYSRDKIVELFYVVRMDFPFFSSAFRFLGITLI